MKFKKLITGSVVAASLLGISLGSSSLNVLADSEQNTGDNIQPKQQQNTNGGSQGNSQSMSTSDNGKIDSNQSQSSANVDMGILNLDSVPNLSFGNQDVTNYTTNLALKPSSSDTSSGINNRNMLRVTDNRNTSSNSGKWSVTASLGQFSRQHDSTTTPSTDNWQLNLNQTSVNNDEGKKPQVNQVPLDNNGNNNYSSPKSIMFTSDDKNSGGHGTNTIQYDSSNANLDIPYNVKIGNYTANINWSLDSNADGKDANSTTPG